MLARPWALIVPIVRFLTSFLGLCALTLGACKSSTPPPAPADPSGDDGGGIGDAAAPLPPFDFTALDAEEFGGAWKAEGLVVMYGGVIAHEKYAPGSTADMRHITYSASKSVGAILVGIAIDQGLMKLTDSVCAYVPAPDAGSDASLCDVTIQMLLEMRSGKQWDEGYGNSATSNVTTMLYGDESDMGAYTAEQPREAGAGTLWNYSSGDANLLADALKGALKGQDVRAWAKTSLFDSAGIKSAVFESDRSGTLVFSSSFFATPRDVAKLGQLFLDKGKVGSTQVVSASWLTYMTTPIALLSTPYPIDSGPDNSGGSYGAQMWLNSATPSAPSSTWEFVQGTADMFSFEGHWGQKIFVIPSRKLVVARFGDDRARVRSERHGGRGDRRRGQGGVAVKRALSLLVLACVIVATGAPDRARADDASAFDVLTGFSAKEGCSCAFVAGQTDDYCTQFAQVQGYTVSVSFDRANDVASATFATVTRTAHYVDGVGCTLDALLSRFRGLGDARLAVLPLDHPAGVLARERARLVEQGDVLGARASGRRAARLSTS